MLPRDAPFTKADHRRNAKGQGNRRREFGVHPVQTNGRTQQGTRASIGMGNAEKLLYHPEIRPCISERAVRSEEHTSELQSLMRISYAVFCLKKKNNKQR